MSFYRRSVLPRLERRFFTKYRVYLFHRVRPGVGGSDSPLDSGIAPDRLAELFRKISGRVRFADDLVANRFSRRSAGECAVTFDDAYVDLYDHVLPLAIRHQIPITVFVNTHHADSGELFWWDRSAWLARREGLPDGENIIRFNHSIRFARPRHIEGLLRQLGAPPPRGPDEDFQQQNRSLNWDEMREMRDSGFFRFEPHTHSHSCLRFLTESEIRNEIRRSMLRLKEELGHPGSIFAYPFGAPEDLHPMAPHIVRELGLQAAFMAWGHDNTKLTDPFRLDRMETLEA